MAKRKANKMRMYTREVKELCDEFDFEYDEDNPLDTVGEIIRYVLNDDAYEDEPLSEAEFDKLPDAKVHMLENLLDAWNDKNLEILEEEEEEEEEAPPKATRRRGGRKAKVKADEEQEEQEEEEQEESSTSNTAALMTKFHEYRDQIMELLDQIEESITTIGDVSESEEEEEEEAPPKTTRRKSSNGRRKKKAAKKKRVAKKRTTKKRGKKKSKRGSSRR